MFQIMQNALKIIKFLFSHLNLSFNQNLLTENNVALFFMLKIFQNTHSLHLSVPPYRSTFALL